MGTMKGEARAAQEAWADVLSGLSPEGRRAMEFLRSHLPESDLACYAPELFLRFVHQALAVRAAAPWCGALDWEMFAHYVLSPRVNDEDLSFHRDIFHDELWPRVKDLPTAEDRVLEVNRWCHEQASYQAQDERTASPLTVYRCGSGRCGEESAFLVSALRSVGIAARQVYVPRWSHCDDNHAWVEALCDGRWRWLGGCEPEPVLDRGWFNAAASRAVLVHSRLFGEGDSPLHGEPLGRTGAVRWFSQTARYAPVKPRTFRALAEGRPAAGAEFHLQILNEAAFHTIAVLTADGQGEAQAALGLGDLHVLAVWDGLTAEGDCGGAEGLTLALAPPEAGDRPWTDLVSRAPAAGPVPPPLSAQQKAARTAVLARGDALRRARMAGYSQPGRADREDLRQKARGGWGEICAFLSGGDEGRRERLVRTLSDKDLRDVSAGVLDDHFRHLPLQDRDMPDEIYWQYIACPRIALEPLTPWRGALTDWLSDRRYTPVQLWRELRDLLPLAEGDGYANLYWTPAEALGWGACGGADRDLLFIALLRTMGVPARLRSLDGAPEIWEDGAFRPVVPEETGTLRLTAPAGTAPRYRQDWSLSRWTPAGWRLLGAEGDWRDGELELALPVGRYRLIASVRLPDGDQLAARCELVLSGGEVRTVPLRMRAPALDELIAPRALPPLPAQALDGTPVPDLFHGSGRPVLVLWLEEGGEPTEHVLGELLERREALAAMPLSVRFLVRGRESVEQPTLAQALAALDGVQVLLDDWAYDLETVARLLGRDPDSPPLAVLCDGMGRAAYSDSGYRPGAVELLLRVAGRLAAQDGR